MVLTSANNILENTAIWEEHSHINPVVFYWLNLCVPLRLVCCVLHEVGVIYEWTLTNIGYHFAMGMVAKSMNKRIYDSNNALISYYFLIDGLYI